MISQIFCRDNEYLPPKTLWPCSWRSPTARRWYWAGSECFVFTNLQHKKEWKGHAVKWTKKWKMDTTVTLWKSAHNYQAPHIIGAKRKGWAGIKWQGWGKAIQPSHLWLNLTSHPRELEVTGNFSCLSNLNPLANKQTQTLAATISHLLSSLRWRSSSTTWGRFIGLFHLLCLLSLFALLVKLPLMLVMPAPSRLTHWITITTNASSWCTTRVSLTLGYLR